MWPAPSEKRRFTPERQFKRYDFLKRGYKTSTLSAAADSVGKFVRLTSKVENCPMPLIMDLWDGSACPFQCKYCNTRVFYQRMYNFLSDEARAAAFRSCSWDRFLKVMGKYMAAVGNHPSRVNEGMARAFAMRIPVRIGSTFENFTRREAKEGVSLRALRYFEAAAYPVAITTKSPLVSADDYLGALSGNKGGAVVHMSVVARDEVLLRRLESGSPTFETRLDAMRKLVKAGVRVVVRYSPHIPFVTDGRTDTNNLMSCLWDAGVRDINLEPLFRYEDMPGLIDVITAMGIDYSAMGALFADDRMSSLMLTLFAKAFSEYGFRTYCNFMDDAPVESMCCGPVDAFPNAGFNWGSTVGIYKAIKEAGGAAVSWTDYERMVDKSGGFLTAEMRRHMGNAWNRNDVNDRVSHMECVSVCGVGSDGYLWRYDKDDAMYDEMIERILS